MKGAKVEVLNFNDKDNAGAEAGYYSCVLTEDFNKAYKKGDVVDLDRYEISQSSFSF